MLLYSITDKYNLNLESVYDVNDPTIQLVSVSVYKSKSIFDPVISDTGNNFLLNEPIIEGIKNPKILLALVAPAVTFTSFNVAPALHELIEVSG